MGKAKSEFLAWPKHLTRDYLGTILEGFGVGCMFGWAFFRDANFYVVWAIGTFLLVAGMVMRGNKADESTNN